MERGVEEAHAGEEAVAGDDELPPPAIGSSSSSPQIHRCRILCPRAAGPSSFSRAHAAGRRFIFLLRPRAAGLLASAAALQ
uniref:Uncharacterized protein n=1 Tax=Leersia perrieri TaxID=77586 RepID=A0A0D9X082_9ORYZ